MNINYTILFLVGLLIQPCMGQVMPPIPPAKEGARPPVEQVDQTKTDLWNLNFKLHEHEDLARIEKTAAVEAGYAFVSVAYHMSIYLHLVDAAEIGEKQGVKFKEFDGPLRKAAFEIARAATHQSEKCDYWLKAVKDEAVRKQILEGQKAMKDIAGVLTDYFNGESSEIDKEAKIEQDEADQPKTALEAHPEGGSIPKKPDAEGRSK